MHIENDIPGKQSIKERKCIPVYMDTSFPMERRAKSYVITGSQIVSSGEPKVSFLAQRETIIKKLPDYNELKEAIDVLINDPDKLRRTSSTCTENVVTKLNRSVNKGGNVHVTLPSGEIFQVNLKIAHMIKVLSGQSSISRIQVRDMMREQGSEVTLSAVNNLFVKLNSILAKSGTEILKIKEPGRLNAMLYKLGPRKPIEDPFSLTL